jgi:hypothetical protein
MDEPSSLRQLSPRHALVMVVSGLFAALVAMSAQSAERLQEKRVGSGLEGWYGWLRSEIIKSRDAAFA